MSGARMNQKLETFDWNWNVTTKVMEVLHLPKVRLGQIELLVCLAAFFLFFLEACGTCRRQRRNTMFRLILWTAYTIPPSLITYTLGLMHAASFKNDLFLIWAIFLVMLLGSADSTNAYNLQDNERWKRHTWQFLIKMMGLLFLVTMYANASTLLIALYILYYVAFLKVAERALSSMLASEAVLQRKTKLIADYMRREHLKSNQDEVDLTTMKGYTYMVDREYKPKWEEYFTLASFSRMPEKAEAPDYLVPIEPESSVVTVEKVWRCQGKLLRADSNHHLKDLCLSFALFEMLCSRFAGYSTPREVNQKSQKLFQKIIGQEDGYERAFRIIEVELSLVFYKLYTKCQTFLLFTKLKYFRLVSLIVGSCIVASTIVQYPKTEGNVQLATPNGFNVDVLLTALVIGTVLVLEIASLLYFSCFSEWGKVSWICSYVRNESWQKCKFMEKLIGYICCLPSGSPWERKLSQYSLLESYGYKPPLLLYNPWTTLLVDQEREGRTESKATELLDEVKSAVIEPIATCSATKLKNGRTSLSLNNMQDLMWACDLETQAQVIMVWHIATGMCEHKVPVKSHAGFSQYLNIATSLSKYLAYLVAYAPRLLPDHPYVTEHVFDQVIIEARETFSNCNRLGDVIRELQHIGNQERGKTVIERGAWLGKQLLDDVKNPETIWMVLAEFWAELMAYVAPSDDIIAHVEQLPKGGEFITHIWALLSHCGIERSPQQDHRAEEEPHLA